MHILRFGDGSFVDEIQKSTWRLLLGFDLLLKLGGIFGLLNVN